MSTTHINIFPNAQIFRGENRKESLIVSISKAKEISLTTFFDKNAQERPYKIRIEGSNGDYHFAEYESKYQRDRDISDFLLSMNAGIKSLNNGVESSLNELDNPLDETFNA